MKKIYAVIPAYEPLDSLVPLAEKVASLECLSGLVAVDDGSRRPGTAEVFAALEKIPRCTVLRHAVNQGKGGAMKTAFRHLLETCGQDLLGAVTVDADGQHLPGDIEKVVREFADHPEDYVLGVRDFHALERQIPLRSRFGNVMTEKVFAFFARAHIRDTQTGLRAYPADFMRDCLKIRPSRYEFELEALLRYSRNGGGDFRQVDIATVYEENNPSSHFRPLRDSLRIYAIFLKFVGASVICSAVDYVIFSGLILWLGADTAYHGRSSVFWSLLTARVISASLNFLLDKQAVFRSSGHWLRQFAGFAALAVFLFTASCLGIGALARLGLHPMVSKLLVEGLLFLLSFVVQNSLIFRRRRKG